jgi:hypothetical protein
MSSTITSVDKMPRVPRALGPTQLVRRHKNKIRKEIPIPILKFVNREKERFDCPICGYSGPFRDLHSVAGFRKHAVCPKCNAEERTRLQYLVVPYVTQ